MTTFNAAADMVEAVLETLVHCTFVEPKRMPGKVLVG